MKRKTARPSYVVVLVVACFSMVILPALCLAGEDDPEKGRENSLKGGAWAIQFQIEDDIGLKPFNGLIISLKRHFSARSALRFGFDLDLTFDGDESDIATAVDDSTVSAERRHTDFNSQFVQVDLSYLFYPKPHANVHLFLGGGPLFRLSRSERDEVRTRTSSGLTTTNDNHDLNKFWAVGGLGMMGVEWFLKERFSFHAEYRAAVSYGRTTSESESVFTSTITRRDVRDLSGDGWDFDGVEVTLGLSVYF